jgi:hypothetical protein
MKYAANYSGEMRDKLMQLVYEPTIAIFEELEAVKSELKSAEEYVEELKTQHISDLRKAEEKGYLNGLKDFAHMECELEAVKAERDALRARIEAAEKREPVGMFNGSFEYIDGRKSFGVTCFASMPTKGWLLVYFWE